MHLTNEVLSDIISKSGVTVVDFYAEWCGPCKMMGPILDSIESSGKATVIKVDTVKFPELSKQYSVQSLPTFCFFVDGELVETKIGVIPKPTLEKMIASYL